MAAGNVGFLYKNLNSNSASDVTVVTGKGATLHSVTINTKGATANTLKIYDGPSASNVLIANIDTTSLNGTWSYDIQVNTGIVCVLNTGTAADVTISYK